MARSRPCRSTKQALAFDAGVPQTCQPAAFTPRVPLVPGLRLVPTGDPSPPGTPQQWVPGELVDVEGFSRGATLTASEFNPLLMRGQAPCLASPGGEWIPLYRPSRPRKTEKGAGPGTAVTRGLGERETPPGTAGGGGPVARSPCPVQAVFAVDVMVATAAEGHRLQ